MAKVDEEQGPWSQFQKAPTEEEGAPWEDFTPQKGIDHPTSQLSSGLQGAAQGVTFGFADELLGGAKAAYDKLKEGGGTFAGKTPYGDFYNKRVQEEREAVQRAKEDNPLTYTAGNVAGGFASNAIPGVGIARGAGLGTTLAKAALQGGLIGAGESVPKDQGEFLGDIGRGAATGAATQGAFSGLAGLAGRLSPAGLDKFAEERAVKAAVGPNVSNLRQAIGTTIRGAKPEDVSKRISKMGRDILDEDVLNTFSKTQDLGPALQGAAQKYGSQIGDIGQTIDKAIPNAVDSKKIASDLAEYAATIPSSVGGKRLQDRVMAEAANFEEMPALGFGQAQALKNQFKYKPVDQDALISDKDVSNKVRSIIGKNMEDATARVSQSGDEGLKDLLQRYQTAKGKYGTFKSASDASGNEATKDLMRRVVSPSDYATGIGTGAVGALATGNPGVAAIGILGAAANKFARERGSSTAAIIANNASQAMKSSPEFAQQFGQILMDAAQRGPAAMTATHLMLMKNPSYSQQFQGQLPSGTPNQGENP